MYVRVSQNCHMTYPWGRNTIMVVVYNTAVKVCLTCITNAQYVCRLSLYRHLHDTPFLATLAPACLWWCFQWRFWYAPSVPGLSQIEEGRKHDPSRSPTGKNNMGLDLENEVTRSGESNHHLSHVPSISLVSAGLKMAWHPGGDLMGFHLIAVWNQHCPLSVEVAAIQWPYPDIPYLLLSFQRKRMDHTPSFWKLHRTHSLWGVMNVFMIFHPPNANIVPIHFSTQSSPRWLRW